MYVLLLLLLFPIRVAAWSKDLRPLACWYCGFASRQAHGCLSLVSIVCCQVAVSASDRSLVHRSPTEGGVSDLNSEEA
jgi:hypothetical protein